MRDGGRLFEVDESALTYVRVNFQTRLQFGRTEVVIESPFRLTVGDATHNLDPNDRGGSGHFSLSIPTPWIASRCPHAEP
jgi:hypothetical protein